MRVSTSRSGRSEPHDTRAERAGGKGDGGGRGGGELRRAEVYKRPTKRAKVGSTRSTRRLRKGQLLCQSNVHSQMYIVRCTQQAAFKLLRMKYDCVQYVADFFTPEEEAVGRAWRCSDALEHAAVPARRRFTSVGQAVGAPHQALRSTPCSPASPARARHSPPSFPPSRTASPGAAA
jgi:hypothetical protein